MRSKRSFAIRFLLCSSVVFTASARVIRTPLEPRVEECQIETADRMADDPNRANGNDDDAGIGAEFESPGGFGLINKKCSKEDSDKAKLHIIDGRQGTTFPWKLTADSTAEAGELHAEYIIDGTKVKVGSTVDETNGAKVAADFVTNLVEWQPWKSDNKDDRMVNIEDNNCNPWRIDVNEDQDPLELYFQPQITTPMPLEALYFLMQEHIRDPFPDRHILDGDNFHVRNKYLILVTKDSFQSNPGGISPDQVSDDVLAFCTLVLSYAKVAKEFLQPGSSPKIFTVFLPRTNFNKMLSHVSSKLRPKGDELWELFNILACYQSGGTKIDRDLCEGTPGKPKPINNNFGDLTLSSGEAKCNIKDWIHGLDPDSTEDDALTIFDAKIDGSIGKLHGREEKMFKSDRYVPLFEFRDLDPSIQVKGIVDFMERVDTAIQKLHTDYATPPGQKARREVPICGDPEPEPEPEPTGPTKQLAVLSSFVVGAPTLDWLFLETDFEQGVGCRDDFLRPFDTEPWDFSGNGAQAGSTFPGGTRELDLTIDGQKCEYRNDGDDPGALWCGERVIGCKNDPADKDPEDASSDKGNYQCGDYTRQPVFVCPW